MYAHTNLHLYTQTNSADEHGGVTLEAFLESEKTLLPQLSRLRLLQ